MHAHICAFANIRVTLNASQARVLVETQPVKAFFNGNSEVHIRTALYLKEKVIHVYYAIRVGTWVNWFVLFSWQQIYEEAKKGFEDALNTKEKGVVLTKDDKAHGSLLIMNELIRSASFEGEVYM